MSRKLSDKDKGVERRPGKARYGVARRGTESYAVAQVTACLAEEMVEYHLGRGYLHCVRKISFPLTEVTVPCCHVLEGRESES